LLVAFSGFYQAVIVNESEPEQWFLFVMVSILLLFAGVIAFLIVKGSKKPQPKPKEPSVEPVKRDDAPSGHEEEDEE